MTALSPRASASTSDPSGDRERLRHFVEARDESAFRELVEHHLGDDIIDQVSALPTDQHPQAYRWRNEVRSRLREILTPGQQAIFDQTQPYRKTR